MEAVDESEMLSVSEEPNEEVQTHGAPETPSKAKPVRLPLARVKHMMKMDPDCGLISQDALFLVTKSAEIFLEYLAAEAVKNMGVGKRKTLQKRDVDCAIDSVPSLCFLDGALE